MNKKICEMVTDRIIEEMNKGLIPWNRPWTCSRGAVSHTTGRPYSLLNQMLLGYTGEYITFKQCQAEGGKVKKGAKQKVVVFWKQVVITETDENGEEKQKKVPMLRYYGVFNIADCEGIKAKYSEDGNAAIHNDPIKEAQKIVDAWREVVSIEDSKDTNDAYYSPSRDIINIPNINQYSNVEEYYSTAFHEMTHSTGHESRLNRFTGAAKNAAFGSEEYSKEELIAEIGAASLVNYCGIETSKTFKNSTAYIQSWIRALRNDCTLIVSASGKAQKAFEMITGTALFAEAEEA